MVPCHSCTQAPPCQHALCSTALCADLSPDERDLVERAYKSGAISLLTATSTMAAGVNLPARRVICQPYVGLKENVLEGAKWRQMAGRAGRAGLDSQGEAILLATAGVPVQKLQQLLQVLVYHRQPPMPGVLITVCTPELPGTAKI